MPTKRLPPALAPAALFLGTLVLFALAYRLFFHGGLTYEFCQYAEIGSNLASGRGYATRSFYPSSLAYLERAGRSPEPAGPVLERFPLPAVWTAFWMAVAGPDDFGMALAGGAAHALWVALLFVIGRRLVGAGPALAAALLWAVHPVFLAGYALRGYPDVLFGAVFLALNGLWWSERGSGFRPRDCAALGLLAGAAYLARHSFVVWLPLFLALPLVSSPRSLKGSLAFFGGFVAVALPFNLWSLAATGLSSPPFGLWNLADGTIVQGLPWLEYRAYSWSDLATAEALGAVLRKAYFNFNAFMKDVPSLWLQFYAFPFALLGMLTARGAALGFAGWVGALFGWQALAFSPLRHEQLGFLTGRYYAWIAPIALLYAAAFLFEKAKDSKAWRVAGATAAALLVQLWLGAYRAMPADSGHPSGLPVGRWPELAYLRDATPSEARIATNIPTQVAWYASRGAVNVPNRPEELVELSSRWRIDYLLISNHASGELANLPRWRALLDGKGSPAAALGALGFELERPFEGAALFRRKSHLPAK